MQALRDLQSAMVKYTPYVADGAFTDVDAVIEVAEGVVQKLCDTRFGAHFCIIWKSTTNKPSKRYRSLEALNAWLAERISEHSLNELILQPFLKAHQGVVASGPPVVPA